ncbi:MAG: hydroxyphenylacetyl-CoA thioesterase PaaI [Acidimicrobiales bacterium]
MPTDAKKIAQDSAAAMFANDDASKLIGITIDDVGPSSATVSMVVRADMTNGLDVCHGGYLFTLADTAMAFASNSRNNVAFATGATVDFIAPGKRGATLSAVAVETNLSGRNAIYDVTVTDTADGTTIALFHGRTRDVTR